jgi:hypothetical protein
MPASPSVEGVLRVFFLTTTRGVPIMRRSQCIAAISCAKTRINDCGADCTDDFDLSDSQRSAIEALESLTTRLGDWDRLKLWSPEWGVKADQLSGLLGCQLSGLLGCSAVSGRG